MTLHVDIRSPIATGAPRAIQPLGASPLELLLGFGDPWEVTVARVLAIHATIASAELCCSKSKFTELYELYIPGEYEYIAYSIRKLVSELLKFMDSSSSGG